MRYSEIWAGGIPAALLLIVQVIVLAVVVGAAVGAVARRLGIDLSPALLLRAADRLGAIAAVLLFAELANPGATATVVAGVAAGVVGGVLYAPARRVALWLVWLGTGWMPLRPPAPRRQHLVLGVRVGAIGALAVLAGVSGPPVPWWLAILLAGLALGAWWLRRQLVPEPHESVTTEEILGCHTKVLEVEGRGPDSGAPLVFLHGYGLSALFWRQVFQVAARVSGRRMVAVSLPGPLSQDATAIESPEHSPVDFVLEAIELMCPGEDVLLVGHSIGGWFALTIGTMQDVPVVGIVALNPAGLVKTWWQATGGSRLVASTVVWLERHMPRWLLGKIAVRVVRRVAPNVGPAKLQAIRDMAENPDLTRLAADYGTRLLAELRANIGQLRVPSLFIFGRSDELFPGAVELAPTGQPHLPPIEVVEMDGGQLTPSRARPSRA